MWNSLKDFIGVPKPPEEPIPAAALAKQQAEKTEKSVKRLQEEREKMAGEMENHKALAKAATEKGNAAEAKYQLSLMLSAKKAVAQLDGAMLKIAKVRAGTQAYNVSNIVAEALEGVGVIGAELHENADRITTANENIAEMEAGIDAVNDALNDGVDGEDELESLYQEMRSEVTKDKMAAFPSTPARTPTATQAPGGFVVTKVKKKE